jgi:Rho termination factor, N-terminal domain
MAQGSERTKEQLYRQAKQLGIKGRSKMNKGQLKAAIERRR